jgi:acyl-CoA hydrolase
MARCPAETISVLTYRTGVQDANLAGNVHGGWIMKLCDDVAVIAATALREDGSSPPRLTR